MPEGTELDFDHLFYSGVMMNLDISKYSGEAPCPPEMLQISAKDVPKCVKMGKVVLIPKEELTDINGAAARARALLRLFSFPYPGLADLKFVPKSVWLDVVSKMEEIKKDFFDAVDEFIKEYDRIRERQLFEYEEHREVLEPCFPSTGNELRKEFDFSWSSYEISLPKEVKKSAYTKEKAAKDQEAFEKMRVQAEQERDKFLGSVVGKLRERTAELFKSVKDRIEGGKKIGAAQVKKMSGFIEEFEQLNFMGDGQIAQALDTMKEELKKASTMGDEDFQKEISGSLDKIVELAEKTDDVEEVTQNYKRNLLQIKQIKSDEEIEKEEKEEDKEKETQEEKIQ